jgi:hypothetical protein
MQRGAHIKVYRGGYWHHGIAMGDGTVIHLAGDSIWKSEARVRRTSIENFARGGEVRVVDWKKIAEALDLYIQTPEIIAAEAQAQLDRRGYNLIFNNCEQFCIYCVTGDAPEHLGQVQDAFREILKTSVPLVGGVPLLGPGVNVIAGCARVVAKKAVAAVAYQTLIQLEARVSAITREPVSPS